MQSVLEMFSFILIMNYVSSAVCLSLRGIQSFPVKNGLSMYNKDLQILHAPMKDDDWLQLGGIPQELMHSYLSPRDVLLSLFQMINLARIHDKYGLKKYWEEKIESHGQRMGNEDSRMKNSALSKCVYVYHRESDLFFDNCCYRITSSIVLLFFPFVTFQAYFPGR